MLILFSIAYFSHHALVADDSKGEVVYREGVVLATHHFRGHVTRCTACILVVLCLVHSSDAKVCDSKIPVLVEHEVFWFDIAVNYAFRVNVLETLKQTSDEELCDSNLRTHITCLILREFAVSTNVVSQVASSQEVHH